MRRILLACLIFCVGATAQAGSNIETEKMTKSEIEEVLVGNTYPLGGNTLKKSKGAFYFESEESLKLKWKGTKDSGSWAANDKSEFCYTVALFGGKECITLLINKTDGGYVHIFEGKKRYLAEGAIEQGNQIK